MDACFDLRRWLSSWLERLYTALYNCARSFGQIVDQVTKMRERWKSYAALS
jgi:hypothetical protein